MRAGLGGNSERGGLRPSFHSSPEREFAAFDELPSQLRQAVACLATTVSAERVLAQYQRALALARAQGIADSVAEAAVVMSCAHFEAVDIAAEAERHLARFGVDLPHRAAGVSIQRGWGPPLRCRRPTLPPQWSSR